jgi:hypothetical protein
MRVAGQANCRTSEHLNILRTILATAAAAVICFLAVNLYRGITTGDFNL